MKNTKQRVVAGSILLVVLVLLVAVGVRNLLLPDRTALVFLDYGDSVNWVPAPENSLFDEGELDWAAYEPVQIAGKNLGSWHEVALINFDSDDAFEKFQQRIDNDSLLQRYHLLDVEPMGPELLSFVNWNIRRSADDSVEIGPRASVEEAIPWPEYADQWRGLFSSPYRDEIVMFNFHAYLDEPKEVPEQTDAGDDDGYERYGEKAKKVLGKLGGRIGRSGEIAAVPVGAELRQYDGYNFVHYPGVDAFELMFTAKDRLDARVHQEAALSSTKSAGYWGKPYKQYQFNVNQK